MKIKTMILLATMATLVLGCISQPQIETTTTTTVATTITTSTTASTTTLSTTSTTATTSTTTTTTLSLNQKDSRTYLEAVSTNNADECLMITDYTLKLECVGEIAIAKDDPTVCQRISDDYHAENCIIDYAVKTGKIKLCEVSDEYRREMCLLGIVKKKPSIEICGEISDTYRNELCWIEVAAGQMNKKQCDNIKDDFRNKLCIMYVAASTGNRNLCFTLPLDDMEDTSRRMTCEAMVLKDPTYCSNIDRRYNWWRTQCSKLTNEP